MLCDGAFRALGEEFIVTSVCEGTHNPASLHYVGFAFDVRTRDLKIVPAVARDALDTVLGEEFDVVIEDSHLHVEFQPKKNR